MYIYIYIYIYTHLVIHMHTYTYIQTCSKGHTSTLTACPLGWRCCPAAPSSGLTTKFCRQTPAQALTCTRPRGQQTHLGRVAGVSVPPGRGLMRFRLAWKGRRRFYPAWKGRRRLYPALKGRSSLCSDSGRRIAPSLLGWTALNPQGCLAGRRAGARTRCFRAKPSRG